MNPLIALSRPVLLALSILLLASVPVWADMEQELRGYRADADAARAEIDKVISGVVDGTNAFRKKNDLAEIKVNAQLTATAQKFADYMATELKYGHEADGRTPADRAELQKYDYCIVLENIAFSFNSRGYETQPLTESFVQGWIDSPPHRMNMLDPDITEIGVGVARSENGVYFGVQVFGRPKSAAINIKIENKSRQPISYTLGDEKFDLPPRAIRTHGLCRPPTIQFDVPAGSTLPPPEKRSPTKATTYTVTSRGDGVEVRAN